MGRSDTSVSSDELWFHLAGGTAQEYHALRRATGSSRRWTVLSRDGWVRAGLAPARARRLDELRPGAPGGRVERERERMARFGVRGVAHRHADYPAGLRHLPQPPLVLCVRGRWPLPEAALAIVGSRAATAYGRLAARRLAGAATEAGWAVVSGLARGIDRFALEACLEAGGWPVAVLGCGVDIAYPREHRSLQDRIAREGTVVSEFPLGQRPTTFAFPRRNRVIAGLSRGVLVVEAGRRSGALITVEHALELGVEVLAVPGPIDAAQSEGTNRLLLDGAAPVVDTASLLAHLGEAPGGPPSSPAASGGRASTSTLRAARTTSGTSWPPSAAAASRPVASEQATPAGEHLLAVLGERALSVDELAEAAERPVREIRSALIALQLGGRVEHLPGDRFARRGAAPLLRARSPA